MSFQVRVDPRQRSLMFLVCIVVSTLLVGGCLQTTQPPTPVRVELWTSDFATTCGPSATAELLAGRDQIVVGAISIGNDDEHLRIALHTSDTWQLAEVHIAVAPTLGGIPTTRRGIPIPGSFPFGDAYDPSVPQVTFYLPLVDLGATPGDGLVVAVQADVVDVETGRGEGAWGAGERFPGAASYATYFTFDVRECPTGPVTLAPGEGGTAIGDGGVKVTVPPSSIPYEAIIDVAPLDPALLRAPLGNLRVVASVELMVEPVVNAGTYLPLNAPLEIEVPAPVGSEDGQVYLVGQEVVSDSVVDHVLQEQFVAVGIAVVSEGVLATTTSALPGALGGGKYAFLTESSSGITTQSNGAHGYVSGTVRDASGPRGGVVVSNSTNRLVAVTDATGGYTLAVRAGSFTVTAFDPFRGSSGVATGFASSGSVTTATIVLTPLATPLVTRDGIRNGGFERGDLSSWATGGAALVREELVCTGATITPTEGEWMADINTGAGAIGGTGSVLTQEFIVPAGVDTLRFDYNFVSDEFPEFVGSIFDDTFLAVLETPNGETVIVEVSVNDSGGFTLIGDCGFPSGDNTTGMTGWRTASIDVSAFAGTQTPVRLSVLFSASDRGDNIYATHVLIDNIRFATVWLDAKILQGADADRQRVEAEIRDANEILSQAGLNVRLRDVRTIANPGPLLDVDITWNTGPGCPDGRVNGRLTDEQAQVMNLARSTVASDVNVYYVRSGTGLTGIAGFAIGPDDFCVDVDILVNSGTLQMDVGRGGNILAHELGHLLISPQTAGNALEHAAPAGNFMSTTPLLGVVNRDQSNNINRAAAPLLGN